MSRPLPGIRDLAGNAALCLAVFIGFLVCLPFVFAGYAYLAAERFFRKDS